METMLKYQDTATKIDVSIIVPIYNGSRWIDPCFESILAQNLDKLNVQVCVCNDSSTDDTQTLLEKWAEIFTQKSIRYKCFKNESSSPKGVGFAKNRAVEISDGEYLCFQDVDDIMLPDRVQAQHSDAKVLPQNYLLGCKFNRRPENSTTRYTNWANNLTQDQLTLQIYTSHGPTIIMPTWFCHRKVFDNVGGFSEDGKGTPEDLIFFYKHLDLDGKVHRVDKELLTYFYHETATTFSIKEETIWNLRLSRLESMVLSGWKSFTIWNAGKQGRKLYNTLSSSSREKVVAFCDVDAKKIRNKYTPYDPKCRKTGRTLDIVHYKDAEPPMVVCVKLDMTNGVFERNLNSLNLTENVDYILFS